jgi:UDP-N-acetyl-D-glucosamine dehydrogenase
VDKTVRAVNDAGRSIRGARICVLGLAYKADIDDDRESPSYEIIELLREAGAVVDYCDPHFPVARPVRRHDIGLSSVPCTAETFSTYDALVLATAHREFRAAGLYAGAALVVDTRNAVQPGWVAPERLVKA